jgi:CheY-like chemotaxis protein
MMEEPRGPRILVVDDDLFLAEVVGRALRLLAMRRRPTPIRTRRSTRWPTASGTTWLIADRRMPGLRGEEVARWAQDLRPNLPVILMSSDEAPAAEGAHLDGVLRKPFSMAELSGAVDRALAARHPAN